MGVINMGVINMGVINKGALALALALALGAGLLLSACGSGGSSSGGGQFDGVYAGGANVSYSARGRTVRHVIRTYVAVSGSDVTVSDGAHSGNARRNGSSYAVPLEFKTRGDGLTCNWKLLYRGELLSALTRGLISGSYSCTDGVTVSVSGSYEIVKQANVSKVRE